MSDTQARSTARPFLGEDFLLDNDYARELYHEYARDLPIIDYHCHLPPDEIAADRQFANLTAIWLAGDHYKWRAMRTNGVAERYITGEASDYEKFAKWAETVPYTMRNPLYHWSHLELRRYFGDARLLSPDTARAIYDDCGEQLSGADFSTRALLRKMRVEVVCTTDDPADSLADHEKLAHADFGTRVLPTFRPDKYLLIGAVDYLTYVQQLGAAAEVDIRSLADLKTALLKRADFFAARGCKLSDHGLERLYAESYTEAQLEAIFSKRLAGQLVTDTEAAQFISGLMVFLGECYHERGWTMQLHLGALRNNATRQLQKLGPDTGFDSIGDFPQARALAAFLDRLDRHDQLPQTIIYNLNPADNEVIATMIGNFNDGSVAGKIQFGSAWWFLDQLDGMEKQLNALSNMGLLSRFVGMLTDSRSFLSYPRHEYFRRLLCQLFGDDIQRGLLPEDLPWIGGLVQDICYRNARRYFDF
jgi:glucuronate isomerase